MYNELRRNTEGYVDPTAAATLNKQEPGDIWTYMDHDCLILQNHGEFSTILMMGDKQRDHSSVEIETTAGTRYTDPRRLTWGYHSRMYRYRETLSREDFEKVVNAIADVMDITVQAAEEDQEPQIDQVVERRNEAITLTRFCRVDGTPAYFHRFVEEDRLLVKVNTFAKHDHENAIFRRIHEDGIISPSCDTTVLHETRALIEWADGRLATVALERVQFADLEG